MRLPRFCRVLVCACLIAMINGCATTAENNILAGGSVIALGHTPTTNIGQTYYLGVFDPREQLPPTLYRIRVQGQASALSRTNFASGWVRADLVDSLSGRIDLNNKGQVKIGNNEGNGNNGGNHAPTDTDKNGLNRRLVMFGPEGFREAPKDHRLVVVMGSDPGVFFTSVDRALGVVAGATQATQAGSEVPKAIWSDLSRLREERRATQMLLDLNAKE